MIIAALVVIVGGGASYYWARGANGKAAASETTTAAVELGPIRQVVSSTGRVVANLDVDIKCKASGEIIKLPYDVSDSVKKGDLLLELDPVDQQRILTQAEVALSASKARLEVAKQNLAVAERTLVTDRRRAEANLTSAEARAADAQAKAEREKVLLASKLASQEEYDTAETAAVQATGDLEGAKVKMDELKTQESALELQRQQVKLAESEVASDNISYSVAQDRLADTKVVAPMDGVVSARNVQTGQIIASAVSNVAGGTTVLTLSDLSHIYVLASVDESYIGEVTVGQRATITADAYPGKRFRGEVVRIATKGANLSNVVTFEVKIEVMGEDKALLKPEMTANVDVICAEKKDALLVPVDAVTVKGGKHVVTLAAGKANGADPKGEEKQVEIGITDGQKTEIVSGLKEGDTVVVRAPGADSRWNSQGRPGQDRGGRGPMMPGMGGGRR